MTPTAMADDPAADPEGSPGVRLYLPGADIEPRPDDANTLANAIRTRALELGFVRVGFAGVDAFPGGAERLRDWLEQGHHGEMDYLNTADDRSDPRALFAQARSMIVAALPHAPPGLGQQNATPDPMRGNVAAYARGPDYHAVLREKLRSLAGWIAEHQGKPLRARVCVDTAPLLEREAARQAGLTFTGKNTLAIAPAVGSHFLIGVVLLDVDLPRSNPLPDGCGSCTACLDACPTQAFPAARQLDARRCISYLTIELRGAIPRKLRPAVGSHVFGCDVCQQVCPYNKSPKTQHMGAELPWNERLIEPDLLRWLALTAGDYRRLVKTTALRRTSQQRLQRNAAVALGNSNRAQAVPHLIHQLLTSRSALVRQHCAWALGRLGGAQAREGLQQAAGDSAPEVRDEVGQALQEIAKNSMDSAST